MNYREKRRMLLIETIATTLDLDDIEEFLRTVEIHLTTDYFSHDLYRNISENSTNGWKVSIQGKSVEDAICLNRMLFDYFNENQIYYKIGTRTRFNMSIRAIEGTEHYQFFKEQSKKAMTVYCPDTMDIKTLCKEIEKRITNYDGFEGVKNPKNYTHFSGGIYFRNDRDENGEYIKNF